MYRDKLSIYDLDQLPQGRQRRCKDGDPLFGLTAHSRLAWCPAEGRVLHRSELGAAPGIATNSALAACYGSHVVNFDKCSRSRAAHMIGNGMSLPCVGSVIWWALTHVTAELGPIPRAIDKAEGVGGSS